MNHTLTMADEHSIWKTFGEWWAGVVGLTLVIISQSKKIWSIIKGFCKAAFHLFTWPSRLVAAVEELTKTLEKFRESTTGELSRLQSGIDELHRKQVVTNSRSMMTFENSQTAMWESTMPGGECVWVNDALAHLFGMEKHAMLGNGWLKAVHYDDREAVENHWQRTINHYTDYQKRYRILVNGQPATVEATATLICDANNKPLRVFGKVIPLPPHT